MIGYFEDFVIGESDELGSFTFTAEDIIRFAESFDPQPFHLSAAGAAKTHFGCLCASGWHTASVFMKLLVRRNQQLQAEARAAGKAVAELGPSPGFENLKWLKPVFAGDTITYSRVTTGTTATRSRPDWGLVHADNHGINQNGEPVFFFTSSVFVQRDPNGAR